MDGLVGAVDPLDLAALVEGDSILDVPGIAVDDDVLEALLAREHRREHDAVVVDPWLRVEDHDLVAAGVGLEHAFEHPAGRHAVADDDKLFHRALPTPPATAGGVRRGTAGRPPGSADTSCRRQ